MKYKLIKTDWNKNKTALRQIRTQVFIEEQRVPEALEWDEFDKTCQHVLVTDNKKPIACGRIKPDGHIGRMAVLKEYRQQGVGAAILKALLKHAEDNDIETVYLHAQVSAVPFYEKLGFNICSEEFLDANIPHRTMEKKLKE